MAEQLLKHHKKIIVASVFALFLGVCLYYMQDGYFDTISVKANAFYFCCAVSAVPGIYLLFSYVKENSFLGLLHFPVAAYVVCLFSLSYLISSVGNPVAMDGSAGWNVGAFSYLLGMMVFFIFLLGEINETVLTAVLAIATIPLYSIAVFQAGGLDLFSLHKNLVADEVHDYISTAGNITVYSGLVSLFIPVVCAALDHTDKKSLKWLYMTDIVIGGTSICLVGSDSAFIGVFGALAVLYIVECKKRTPLWKLARIAALLSASFCVAEIIEKTNPVNAFPARKYFSYYIYEFHLAFILLPLILLLGILLYVKAGEFSFPWKPITVMIIAAIAITEFLSPKGRHFGSGRGEIWTFAVKAFRNESVTRKLCGVGANCFGFLTGAYAHDPAETSGTAVRQNVLSIDGREVVNCHNEFLEHLLCGGVITVSLWCLLVISVIVSGLRRKKVSTFLFGFIGWLIQSMLNNPHDLLLPFVYICAAISISTSSDN